MPPVPAVQLVAESFHRSWGLWLQAPIVLLVLALTARAIGDAVRSVAWSRTAVAIAIAAPIVVALLLPMREYHFAGHEGAYGELLDGELPETGDLSGHRTFGVPAGLAFALGKVAPGERARTAWLAANRGALTLLLLALGLAAASLASASHRAPGWGQLENENENRSAGRAGGRVTAEPARPKDGRQDGAHNENENRAARRAMLAAVLGALACPPLLGWSATAFFVVPALAMAALALALGATGRPAAALAWGALAIGARMETAPMLLAAAAMAGPGWWRGVLVGGPGTDAPGAARALRGARVGLAGALAAFAFQAFVLSQKRSELPLEDVRPDPSVIFENLSLLGLAGPWFTPLAALAVAAVAVLGRPRAPDARTGVVAVAAVIAIVQPALLVDLGARHLLPAVVLLVAVLAPFVARASSPGSAPAPSAALARAAVVLLAAALAIPTAAAVRDLAARYMHGADAYLPRWVEAADAGPSGPPSEVLRDACYLVVPGGRHAYRGTRDSTDVREVHRAALARDAGWCVQWAVGDDAEFSGDTRAERLDRAIAVLDLVPVGWIDPAPAGTARWLVFEPR